MRVALLLRPFVITAIRAELMAVSILRLIRAEHDEAVLIF